MRRVRRSRHRQRNWNDSHIERLAKGTALFPDDAWGPWWGAETKLAAFRASFNRHRSDPLTPDEIEAAIADMQACYANHYEAVHSLCTPSEKPWAWWVWESQEPRNWQLPEWLQLLQMGVIAKEIADQAAAAENERYLSEHDHYHPDRLPFRRPTCWWFLSTEPRDEQRLELSQLVAMKATNSRERAIVNGDEQAMRGYSTGSDKRYWLQHLSDAERDLLGLPKESTTRPAGIASRN